MSNLDTGQDSNWWCLASSSLLRGIFLKWEKQRSDCENVMQFPGSWWLLGCSKSQQCRHGYCLRSKPVSYTRKLTNSSSRWHRYSCSVTIWLFKWHGWCFLAVWEEAVTWKVAEADQHPQIGRGNKLCCSSKLASHPCLAWTWLNICGLLAWEVRYHQDHSRIRIGSVLLQNVSWQCCFL